MREGVKRIIGALGRRRYVGRLVRIGATAWRAPELRLQLAAISEQVASTQNDVRENQLARLLETITTVHNRQQSMSVDEANLVRSVPVALRRATSAHRTLQEELNVVAAALQTMDERLKHLEGLPVAEEHDRLFSLEGRVEEHARTLTYLLERIEFVRSELLFEVRYGANSGGGTIQPHAHAPDFQMPQGDIRLNLGSGHIPLEGYVNVDSRELPGVDLVGDAANLPFDTDSVTEIFSSHFLEHFPEEQLTRVLLPEFRRMLKPGGHFRAVVPDVEAMMRAYVANAYDYDDMKQVIYGGQDYDGDFHFNMFTESSMAQILNHAGFTEVTAVAVGRRNGKSLELEISARKPGGNEATQ